MPPPRLEPTTNFSFSKNGSATIAPSGRLSPSLSGMSVILVGCKVDRLVLPIVTVARTASWPGRFFCTKAIVTVLHDLRLLEHEGSPATGRYRGRHLPKRNAG